MIWPSWRGSRTCSRAQEVAMLSATRVMVLAGLMVSSLALGTAAFVLTSWEGWRHDSAKRRRPDVWHPDRLRRRGRHGREPSSLDRLYVCVTTCLAAAVIAGADFD